MNSMCKRQSPSKWQSPNKRESPSTRSRSEFVLHKYPKLAILSNRSLYFSTRLLTIIILCQLCSAACIPFDQARNHLGETQCVAGKVIRVKEGNRGVRFLDFCADYRLCTFTVVVFPYDLKKIGDVRELAGKLVEIRGEVTAYDDRAEIVLENSKQLVGGDAMHLSPLPKNFDVEERGHFSAGSSRLPHASTTHKKKGTPTLPADSDDPESY